MLSVSLSRCLLLSCLCLCNPKKRCVCLLDQCVPLCSSLRMTFGQPALITRASERPPPAAYLEPRVLISCSCHILSLSKRAVSCADLTFVWRSLDSLGFLQFSLQHCQPIFQPFIVVFHILIKFLVVLLGLRDGCSVVGLLRCFWLTLQSLPYNFLGRKSCRHVAREVRLWGTSLYLLSCFKSISLLCGAGY